MTPSNYELITKIVSSFIKSLEPSIQKLQSDVIAYEPMKGGRSVATLFRFDLAKHSYVLRLFPPHTPQLTRLHQIMLANQAGIMQFGPKIHFVDSQLNGIIMEFIPGRTVQASDFDDASCLTGFATFLQRLHRSEENFPLAVSPFKRLHDFYLKMEKNSKRHVPQFAPIKKLMEELEALFQLLPIMQVPSHLDLHPLNIMIWEKQFFLLDWVNGGLSDPYFDLTTFSVFHSLKDTQEALLLSEYFGREPTDLEWNRFTVTKPIRLFVIAAAIFSADSDSSMSYHEIIRDVALPSLSDLAKQDSTWPPILIGAASLQTALSLINENRFKKALYSLKNKANSTVHL